MMPRYEHWRKSSHSAPDGDCVEVGNSATGMIGVRDTKGGPESPVLHFSAREWAAFLASIQDTSPTTWFSGSR